MANKSRRKGIDVTASSLDALMDYARSEEGKYSGLNPTPDGNAVTIGPGLASFEKEVDALPDIESDCQFSESFSLNLTLRVDIRANGDVVLFSERPSGLKRIVAQLPLGSLCESGFQNDRASAWQVMVAFKSFPSYLQRTIFLTAIYPWALAVLAEASPDEMFKVQTLETIISNFTGDFTSKLNHAGSERSGRRMQASNDY